MTAAPGGTLERRAADAAVRSDEAGIGRPPQEAVA
jgi:hypothetical protein